MVAFHCGERERQSQSISGNNNAILQGSEHKPWSGQALSLRALDDGARYPLMKLYMSVRQGGAVVDDDRMTLSAMALGTSVTDGGNSTLDRS